VFTLITQLEHELAFTSVGNTEELVATINQYLFAPLTDDQLKVGVVEIPVASLDGELRVGAESNAKAESGVTIVKIKNSRSK